MAGRALFLIDLVNTETSSAHGQRPTQVIQHQVSNEQEFDVGMAAMQGDYCLLDTPADGLQGCWEVLMSATPLTTLQCTCSYP
jgi:hypothetical protein